MNIGSPELDLYVTIGLVISFWSQNMCKYIKTCLKVVLIIILKKNEEIKHTKIKTHFFNELNFVFKPLYIENRAAWWPKILHVFS